MSRDTHPDHSAHNERCMSRERVRKQIETLRTSLHWQEQAAANARNIIQRERCTKAAARLREQISELTTQL